MALSSRESRHSLTEAKTPRIASFGLPISGWTRAVGSSPHVPDKDKRVKWPGSSRTFDQIFIRVGQQNARMQWRNHSKIRSQILYRKWDRTDYEQLGDICTEIVRKSLTGEIIRASSPKLIIGSFPEPLSSTWNCPSSPEKRPISPEISDEEPYACWDWNFHRLVPRVLRLCPSHPIPISRL
jgi:hypothetical protein